MEGSIRALEGGKFILQWRQPNKKHTIIGGTDSTVESIVKNGHGTAVEVVNMVGDIGGCIDSCT